MKTETDTQKSLDFARSGRDASMTLVAEHAGEQWINLAYRTLVSFANINKVFMTEDVRAYAVANGVDCPHDSRAWGPVVTKAIKAGLITRFGYSPSKTGHMRPMPVWLSTVCTNAI